MICWLRRVLTPLSVSLAQDEMPSSLLFNSVAVLFVRLAGRWRWKPCRAGAKMDTRAARSGFCREQVSSRIDLHIIFPIFRSQSGKVEGADTGGNEKWSEFFSLLCSQLLTLGAESRRCCQYTEQLGAWRSPREEPYLAKKVAVEPNRQREVSNMCHHQIQIAFPQAAAGEDLSRQVCFISLQDVSAAFEGMTSKKANSNGSEYKADILAYAAKVQVQSVLLN